MMPVAVRADVSAYLISHEAASQFRPTASDTVLAAGIA
jgi:hypothetical protein